MPLGIQGLDGQKDQILFVRAHFKFIRGQINLAAVLKGTALIPRHFPSVLVIGDGRNHARLVGHAPISKKTRSLFMIDRLPALPSSVDKEFHLRRIRAGSDVHHLTRIEIPVREYVHHGLFPIIRPFRLKYVIGILWKARRVNLTEIRILGMVWRRLTNVIKSGPDKLAKTKRCVPVIHNDLLRTLRTPAGRRISQGRAL